MSPSTKPEAKKTFIMVTDAERAVRRSERRITDAGLRAHDCMTEEQAANALVSDRAWLYHAVRVAPGLPCDCARCA